MRASTRERIIRAIAGALIASDVSLRDIEEFSESLSDDSFHAQLKMTLNALTNSIRGKNSPKSMPLFEEEELGAEAAYKVIQARRLSKHAVLKQLIAASPMLGRMLTVDQSLKHMLQSFFKNASKQEARLLMDRLTRIGARDPYLEGILNRQKSAP